MILYLAAKREGLNLSNNLKDSLNYLLKLKSEQEVVNDKILTAHRSTTLDSVTGSDRSYPYTQHLITIEGADEKCNRKLQEKYKRLSDKIAEQIFDIENQLEYIDDPESRNILRMRFVIGMSLNEIGNKLQYDRSTIGKKIKKILNEV